MEKVKLSFLVLINVILVSLDYTSTEETQLKTLDDYNTTDDDNITSSIAPKSADSPKNEYKNEDDELGENDDRDYFNQEDEKKELDEMERLDRKKKKKAKMTDEEEEEPDDVDTSDYNDAIQEKYPCHGLVYRKRPKRWRGDHDTRWKYLCGATLINMMTLVTAAHCVHNTSGIDWPNATIYQLRAGIFSDDNSERRALNYYRYQDDYSGKPENGYDMIVMMLERPFAPARHLKAIHVCTAEQESSEDYELKAVALGAKGYDYENRDENRMKEIDVKEVPVERCLKKYINFSSDVDNDLPPNGSVACITPTASGSTHCKGDDASGLFKVNKKTGNVVCFYGINSVGHICGSKDPYPTVMYTRVSFFSEILPDDESGGKNLRTDQLNGCPKLNLRDTISCFLFLHFLAFAWKLMRPKISIWT